MRREFRNRAFLPVFVPVVVLVSIGLLVGLFAAILLWNTRVTAITLAVVTAGGILFAVALANTRDELGRARRTVVILAGFVPVAVGGAFALGAVNIPSNELNINREPEIRVPADAPELAAESAQSFCLPQPDGSCKDTHEWDVTPSKASEQFAYFFDNRDSATGPHNLAIYTLGGNEQDPTPGDALNVPDPFNGPARRGYLVQDATVPQTFFFQCTVHPSTMWGIGKIVPGDGSGTAGSDSSGGGS